MEADIRRKLSMGKRALDFALANPSTDASYNALVARLQDRLARADAISVQQRDGHTGENSALAHRDAIQGMLRVQLHHLVSVAAVAVQERPELVGVLVMPVRDDSHRALVTAAKAMLPIAVENKDLLISLGLGDTFIDDMTQAVAAFDQSTDDAHAGRRDHVSARVELEVVAKDCVKLAGLMNGLFRIRFRNDPASLAAWNSSKNVVVFRAKHEEPLAAPEPVPVSPPAPVNRAVVEAGEEKKRSAEAA